MPLFKKIVILSCVFVFLSSAQTALAAIEGKVIAITDGDTLRVVDHKNIQHKIRLAEIDTPEKGQPYGQKAKEALSDLVFGKMVRVDVVTTDKYNRLVGHIYLNDLHVNKEMVRLGAAWAYRQYLKDKSFLDIEEEAHAATRGLWALSEAQNVPPCEMLCR
jgi:micrococcal nuclease